MAAFAVAVVVDEEILKGEGRRSIDHRGTQLVFAAVAVTLGGLLVVVSLMSLLRARPDVVLDADELHDSRLRRRAIEWGDLVVTSIVELPRRHRLWPQSKTVLGFVALDEANGTAMEFTEVEYDRDTLVTLQQALTQRGRYAEWAE